MTPTDKPGAPQPPNNSNAAEDAHMENAKDDGVPELKNVYQTYLGRGADAMDSRTWIKLLKDTGIIDRKSFTTTDADLIFTKTKKGNFLPYDNFLEALGFVTARKKVSFESVCSQILETEGPKFVGTKAAPTRLHDDKSTYTGVHAHGGPSTVDKRRHVFSEYDPVDTRDGASVRLEELLDRTKGTVRGLNQNMPQAHQ